MLIDIFLALFDGVFKYENSQNTRNKFDDLSLSLICGSLIGTITSAFFILPIGGKIVEIAWFYKILALVAIFITFFLIGIGIEFFNNNLKSLKIIPTLTTAFINFLLCVVVFSIVFILVNWFFYRV